MAPGKKEANWKAKLEALKLTVRWTYNSSKHLTIIVVLATVFGGLLSIVEPYLFKLLIDRIVVGEMPVREQVGIGIIGVLAIYGVARFLQNVFWDIVNIVRKIHIMRTESYAMHEMMKNISSLDLVYFEDPKYYNTLSRATSSLWRMLDTFGGLTFFIGEIVSVVVIIGTLLFYDWRLVALVIFASIPSILMTLRTSEVLWSAFWESSPISRHAKYYSSLMTESPEAIKEIRSFGLREHFLGKFRDLFHKFLQKQEGAAFSQFKWYLVIGLVEGSLSVVAAWLVVQMFLAGRITVGELTFLWALLFQFAAHARWVVRMVGDMNTNTTFLTPVVDVVNYKPRITDAPNPKTFPKKIRKGIEFRNVTFYYPGAKKPALKNVNLFIKPNESVALVGENGSGKTTLIKLLCRFYDVTKGEILIDGVNIKEYSLKSLYENLGVIFQDFMKYEALIQENIGFGNIARGRSKKQVHEAAVKSGAWDFIKELDNRYKTRVGKKLKEGGIDLSVGQWQKMALARAFFRDAQVVILDEPTAAVDAKAEYQLFQRFGSLTENKTTILISHRFSTVRMADRIIVMDRCKVAENGNHQELLRKGGRYAKLFKLQAKGYK